MEFLLLPLGLIATHLHFVVKEALDIAFSITELTFAWGRGGGSYFSGHFFAGKRTHNPQLFQLTSTYIFHVVHFFLFQVWSDETVSLA